MIFAIRYNLLLYQKGINVLYCNVIKANLKDESALKSLLNYTDKGADHDRFEKFGALLKFWVKISPSTGIFIIIYPSEKLFMNAKNEFSSIIKSLELTGSKLETFSGEIENLSYNNIFYDALRKIGTEFSLD